MKVRRIPLEGVLLVEPAVPGIVGGFFKRHFT